MENAERFDWASVTGALNAERVSTLDRYVVGPDVLDAGCGGGGYVDYLSRRGFAVTGVDKYPMFLDVASEKGYRGKFVEADLDTRLPFEDRSFDSTICFDVLEHVTDDAATFAELARVTRQRLIVAVPLQEPGTRSHGLVPNTYMDPTHVRYYTAPLLSMLAGQVRPREVTMFGQQPITLLRLTAAHIRPNGRYKVLTNLYQRAFRFLLTRCREPGMYTNLVAVVDL